ncbi:unnamed protein product [Kuraishia capsulata CBS 1993]|uniref:N-acetylglucosamine-6-phosphate deacetylase n=1 Tax=Kuraishia capsulata CBS 1993 TaxID=1382522 RepID=W6MLV1_9ASCO|nr:uncharacterized protein KUCA_T00001828001 [Kuraishia capsulata CBS 1993]CDK25857.1 unnamed protein product [Kuraishia capsulata CBS 1993]
MTIAKFTNCTLCDKGVLRHNAELYVDLVAGTIANAPVFFEGEVVDLQGMILAPGFLDIQINGCYGFDFSHFVDEESYLQGYRECLSKLLHTGVTSVCPTLVTNYPEMYARVLPLVTGSRNSDTCDSLGAHCEGPFISMNKKGCHPPECLRDAPNGFASMQEVYGSENFYEHVAIVTAAPEIEGVLGAVTELTSKGVVYSIGHTEADYATSTEAMKLGASMITHIYNAMPQPHHREPGVVGLVSDRPVTPYFGLVADGIHVHHAAAALAYHAAPERCCLVTDAMTWLGCKDGTYAWDDRFVEKKGPLLHLKGSDTIAGSATELPQCIQNLMKWCQISLAEAIGTVTNNPALSLGIKHKGYLDVGCDADLTVLDLSGNVKQVYKLGKKVFDDNLKQHL